MIFLYILLALIALFLLIALIPVKIRLITDGEIKVDLFIAFVKKRLLPQKQSVPKTSDFEIKKFRAWRLKQEKKRIASKRKDKEVTKGEKKKATFAENVSFGTDLINYVVLAALERFGKHVKIYIGKLAVFVGGNEPDKVAVSYGAVSSSVLILKELLDSKFNVRYKKGRIPAVTVNADFISGHSTIEAHIVISMRFWQLLSVGLAALKGFVFDMKKAPAGNGEIKKEKNKNNDMKEPVKTGKEV